MLALLSIVPVGLGLSLLAFGVPGAPMLERTRRNLAAVAGAAVVLGPAALLALGFFGWLVVIALLIIGVLLGAGLKPPRSRALQE